MDISAPVQTQPIQGGSLPKTIGNAVGNAVDVRAVRALGTLTDELEDVRGVADLDCVAPKAHVLAGGLALVTGARTAAAAVAGFELDCVGAERQIEAVLWKILAGRAVGAVAHQLPLAGNIADLNARVWVGALVCAEGAGGVGFVSIGKWHSDGRGGEDESGSDGLHFE